MTLLWRIIQKGTLIARLSTKLLKQSWRTYVACNKVTHWKAVESRVDIEWMNSKMFSVVFICYRQNWELRGTAKTLSWSTVQLELSPAMEKAVTGAGFWECCEREEECRSWLEYGKLRMHSGQPSGESVCRMHFEYREKAGIVPHGHWKTGIMRFVMKVPQQK